MKKVMAVAVGFLVALAPAGTAFAGEPAGNAYGNCKNSAGGGSKVQLAASTLPNAEGLGGFTKGAQCEPVAAPELAPEPAPAPAPVSDLG